MPERWSKVFLNDCHRPLSEGKMIAGQYGGIIGGVNWLQASTNNPLTGGDPVNISAS